MKDWPIQMSTAMVQALLDGRKTVTRRVVNAKWKKLERASKRIKTALWVQEQAMPLGVCGTKDQDGKIPKWPEVDEDKKNQLYVLYKATPTRLGDPSYHPAMYLPRWASRITLLIEDVNIELLQDMTEQDAKDEGVEMHPDYSCNLMGFQILWDELHGHKMNEAWIDNPEVAAITFSVVQENIDTVIQHEGLYDEDYCYI